MSVFKHRLGKDRKGAKAQPTLMKGVLLRIFAVAMVVVTILSFFSYFYIYNNESERRLDELKADVADRMKADRVIFDLAEDNMEAFKKAFLQLYLSDVQVTEQDFRDLYYVDTAGATRMNKEQFTGVYTSEGTYHYGLSGFIGNNQPTDDADFQRRMVLAYRIVAQLGPAWVNRFANVYASFPENAIVLFWPEEPWGLEAKADLPMNELGVIKAATQQENPQRKPTWSGLYYDETAQEWMITYQVPVDVEGRHLINPSHDVYLTDLMDRLLSEHPKGGYNFLIAKDGYLIAHPSGPTEEQRWVGELSLDKIKLPAVVNAYHLIDDQFDENIDAVQIIKNPQNNSYLAVGQMKGPEWWFVSVLPMQVIEDVANQTALAFFAQGMILVLAILGVVYLVILYQAEKPLKQLRYAAELIGQGEYDKISEQQIPLPLTFRNEIGLLSKRFVEMASNIGNARRNLELVVDERTKELELANASLRKLSFYDGLTGVYNRRAFDLDMEQFFTSSEPDRSKLVLILADVDHFKLYNDIYGHTAGDHVLRTVCQTIQEHCGSVGRVYRYGGEELAILMDQTDEAAAGLAGEAILDAVRALQLPHSGSKHQVVTLSAGLASYVEGAAAPQDLIEEADRKLYLSKSKGRNVLTV